MLEGSACWGVLLGRHVNGTLGGSEDWAHCVEERCKVRESVRTGFGVREWVRREIEDPKKSQLI